jgi:molybdopterin-guanine dinucleotide biosynthesis protein A
MEATMAPRVAVLILAGGEGARLGGAIKADLSIGGVRLLERVAAVLAGHGPMLVSIGRHDAAALRLPEAALALPDPAGGRRGPLAGLAAAAAWCATQPEAPGVLVTAAVDTPFLPAGFVPKMVEALGEHDAVIASHAGQAYPTNAAWRTEALVRLLVPEVLAAEAGGGIKGFARSLRTRLLEWPASLGGDPFANLNTPEDREMLERRAAGDYR